MRAPTQLSKAYSAAVYSTKMWFSIITAVRFETQNENTQAANTIAVSIRMTHQ